MVIAQQSLTQHTDHGQVAHEWASVCQRLQAELGEATFRSWIVPLVITNFGGGLVQIAAPTRFMKDWVATNFLDRIRNHWQDINPTIDTIDLIVRQVATPVNLDAPQTAPSVMSDETEIEGSFIGSTLDPRFTFDNFVVGKPNELAYAAALRVAESATVQFNPLFLYGGVGLGKTHLMHAIAWHIKKCHPDRRVIYLSAEKFMYQFIRALRYKDTVAFKEQFRSVDVLMIDDVQFISGKDTTQEEFFHTFNALVDRNHQVIVSADKSPSDLQGMEERLKSRLGWGLVADIHPTTYELRLGILQSKAETLHTVVPKDVLEFLAFKIVSNVRELEGALNRIIAHSTLVGREINLEMTQDVLRDLLKANDRRITVDDIQKRVAEYYSIKISDMQSSRRSQNVARPRQVAMYLSKVLTSRSLPDIGRKFGGRDHTTVLHAVRKVEELMASDREFSEDLSILRRTLEV
ncbi:chromosomal replication initiator protein DnaA [Candidatus Odyssella thessalonicensis]|uniref:chromosomal replication initiator protein DnaA n=1 Tax=Candidatus Odyssella thessalonicensis TaxID=84647 RepID=UPI000225A96E|nr:chromosomal replication initiator protein DnaA [Candidatus Odyssella thessalonicensis]